MGPARAALIPALLALAVATSASAQNRALKLDGAGGALKVTQDVSLEPATRLTVEAWVRGIGYQGEGFIVNKAVTEGYALSLSHVLTTLPTGRVNCTGSYLVWDMMPQWYSETWHHFAFTAVAGHTERLYIDGHLAGTAPGAPCMAHTGDLFIGAKNGTAGQMIGQVDEVRLWNIERTPEEIEASMFLVFDSAPGLVSVWHLDGNGQDASGSNDGTLVGTATFGPAEDVPFGIALVPARGDWRGGSTIALEGKFGAIPGPIEVLFGDVPSPAVSLVGPGMVSAVVPPAAQPGMTVPVRIQSPQLQLTVDTPFVYTPALTAWPHPQSGRLQAEILLDPPARLIVLAGTTPAVHVPPAPWAWMLQCAPALRTFTAWAPLQDRIVLGIPVPESLATPLVTIVLQSLVTNAAGTSGSFSNAVTIDLQDAEGVSAAR